MWTPPLSGNLPTIRCPTKLWGGGLAITRFSMGGLAYMQGNLDLAIRYLEEARDIFRRLGSPHVKVAEKALRIYRRKAGR